MRLVISKKFSFSTNDLKTWNELNLKCALCFSKSTFVAITSLAH